MTSKKAGKAGAIDWAGINAQLLASVETLLPEWLPDGYARGNEYVARNPTRADEKPGSFKINMDRGTWSDFALDDAGGSDLISLYAYIHGMEMGEAAKELGDKFGRSPEPKAKGAKKKKAKPGEWKPVLPAPDHAGPPQAEFPRKSGKEWERLPVVAQWAYLDASGHLLGYVCRLKTPDGGKDVIPQTWCRNTKTGKEGWRWKSLPEPRPLYGLDVLAEKPDANVLVVEGEKAADAAQRLMPGLAVTTWPGGCKAQHKADWAPLKGRKVIFWPDADAAGLRAIEGATKDGRLRPGAAQLVADAGAGAVKVAEPPAGVFEGWDAADAEAEGWSRDQAVDFLRNSIRDPQPHSDDPPAPEAKQEAQPADDFPDEPEIEGWQESAPFRVLGHDRKLYYYMPAGKRQVVELKASEHSKNNLMMLARLQWWERAFPGKQGAQWDAAVNALVQACHEAGPFDPARIRGRGAWWDDGASVLHLGNQLVVSDSIRPVHDIDSRYVYEEAPPMRANFDNPLSSRESVELVRLCEMLNWEKPINAIFLAGWCLLAPICGALDWRPHIWLTGSSGSGKTWVMGSIIRRTVGDSGLFVQSATTEAGMRQSLGHDARPVVFDEAEGESTKARSGLETVMQLMRQASSESGASIVKGSANGQAQSFRIRSMFAFASIGVGLQQYSDKSRVTILGLNRNEQDSEAAAHFKKIKEKWLHVVTKDFVERLHARAFKLIPIIRANAETFAVAAAEKIGAQRMGDQIGALLAGAYALHKTEKVTLEAAREWVARQNWEDERALEEQRDEEMCLSYLMEQMIQVQGPGARYDRTVGEMVLVASMADTDFEGISQTAADDALGRSGMRISSDNQYLLVSTTHTAIKRILRDTPWGSNWGRILERLEGSSRVDNPVRFMGGSRSRAIKIPIGFIKDGE